MKHDFKIAPSILSADWGNLSHQIKQIEKFSDLLHLDVMDGHFVPNLTFGPKMVYWLKKITHLDIDSHLMISAPQKFVEEFAKNGSKIITFHYEIDYPIKKIIKQIKNLGKKVGISIKPKTDWKLLIPYLELVDIVLIMTVEPGFGGQNFLDFVVDKIVLLNQYLLEKKLKTIIEVDGGINDSTAIKVYKAGARILVCGNYIFGNKNPSKVIKSLRNKLQQIQP